MLKSSTGEIRLFLETVSGGRIHGYNEGDAARKSLFHSSGKRLLKSLANDLGYRNGEYDVRSNMAGIAICGEVTLHSDDLYVQISKGDGNGLDILYRTCEGRQDYCGGDNHWLPFDSLRDYPKVVSTIGSIRQGR